MCPANQIKENKASVFNFCTGLHKVVGKPSKLQNTWPFFCLVMQVSRYVRPYVTHSQNSVTGEVKFRLEALAAIQRDLFLRTVSSMQRSVFQGWLHLAQGSSVRKHWNEKQKRYLFCDVDFCENIAHPESDTCNALQTSSGDENSPGEQVLWQQVIGVMKGETSKDSVVHKQGRSENTLSLLHRLGNTSENCCRWKTVGSFSFNWWFPVSQLLLDHGC